MATEVSLSKVVLRVRRLVRTREVEDDEGELVLGLAVSLRLHVTHRLVNRLLGVLWNRGQLGALRAAGSGEHQGKEERMRDEG